MSRGGGGGGRPVPGKPYTTTDDEDVEIIAAQAYGDPTKGPKIWGANPQLKKASQKIPKGTTFIIPGEPPTERLTGKQPGEMTVVIDGREIPMESARIVRTMDTACDGWTGRIAWTPGADPALDRATRPYGYPRAAAYIGNQLLVSGALYGVAPEMTTDGISKTLTGYSFTADAVDSHMIPPYERTNITLEQIASELAPLMGIKAVFRVDSGGPFARVTAHESDTIHTHLSKLASERGILVSNTVQGNLLFHRAVTSGKPVGTLREGEPLVREWRANYDGRQRFHTYKCIHPGSSAAAPLTAIWGQGAPTTQRTGPTAVVVTDPDVPRSRWLSFRADDTTPGNIHDAARWRKNKQLVEALTQELPVTSWYAPNGELWEPNTLVTVVSAVLGVPKGFTFLIRSVEFILEGGCHAVIHLVPPHAYSRNKDLGEVWSL